MGVEVIRPDRNDDDSSALWARGKALRRFESRRKPSWSRPACLDVSLAMDCSDRQRGPKLGSPRDILRSYHPHQPPLSVHKMPVVPRERIVPFS